MYFAYLGDTNIATASLSDDGSYLVSVHVEAPYRRKGVSTALYDFIERHIGHPLKPSPRYQSEDAKKFWENRGGAVVVPVQGGTQIHAAPKQESPVVRTPASVPHQTTRTVSVPLETAIPDAPVVTTRILPLSELKVLAAGLNPQRKVSNIKDLIAEANRRNPTKMIP